MSISAPGHGDRLTHASTPTRIWLIRVLLFALSAAVGGGFAWLINTRVDGPFDVSTTVLGYPVFGNFNVEHYFVVYFLIVLVMPLATLTTYSLGARVLRVSQTTPLRLDHFDCSEELKQWESPSPLARRGVLAVVACTFGIQGAIAANGRIDAFWLVFFGTIGTYIAAVEVVGRSVARSRSMSTDDGISLVTALTAPAGILGLSALSLATHVTVLSTGEVDKYGWLPLWLAITGTAVIITWVVRRTSGSDDLRFARAARGIALYISIPIFLFSVLARIPSMLGKLDLFHIGEGLAAADLTLDGARPWADLISIHGLANDVLSPIVGLKFLEYSAWGADAGKTLFLIPLYWCFHYLLFLRVFRGSQLMVAITTIATITAYRFQGGSILFTTHDRMLLVPIVFILFGRFLDRPSWPRAASLAGLSVLHFVTTPETAYLVGAIAVTTLAFDWFHRSSATTLRATFDRTIRFAICGAISVAIFLIYLALTGAFSRYFQWYEIFAKDHNLTGGIPIQWGGTPFAFVAITMPILVLLAFWYCVAHLRARKAMPVEDWMMLAAAIFVLLYYQKFLGRADGHVFHSWAVAIPLFYYEIYKVLGIMARLATTACRALDPRSLGWRIAPHAPFLIALTVVTAVLGPDAIAQIGNAPKQYRVEVAAPAALQREGYSEPGTSSAVLVDDARKVLDTLLPRGETMFDFTNTPALFHFLLDEPSPTRYYHISMAIPQAAQRDLIGELKASNPAVAVYQGNRGLGTWDGLANSVRHYDVSKYLLAKYRPVIYASGYLFMLRNDLTPPIDQLRALPLSAPPVFDDLYGVTGACDWGYSPNFFAVRPDKHGRRSAPLKGSPTSAPVTLRGWAADSLGTHPAAKIVVATDDGIVLASTRPGIARADVAAATGVPNLGTSGFSLSVTPPRRSSGLHVFVLDATGPARILTPPEGVNIAGTGKPPTAILIGSEVKQVDEKKANGSLDAADRNASTAQATLYRLPSDAHNYQWLEITTADQFSDDTWALSQSGDSTRGVLFRTLPRQEKTYRVMLANCAQWRSYDGGAFVLSHQKPETIRAVRLVGGPVP